MPKSKGIDATLFMHAFIPVSIWISENYVAEMKANAERAAREKARKTKQRQFRHMTGRFFMYVQRKRRQNLRRQNIRQP